MTDDFKNNAVLLLVFNRPDCFRALIETVRCCRPSRVYVAADGPRTGNANDARLCMETRALVSLIDWPCDLETRFLDENFGCTHAVSSAISWFFEHESEGIILEDDCQPAPDFFGFCYRMLELYRDYPQVMHVAGCNLGAPASIFGNHAYGFSSLPIIWGWGTWKRAWSGYQADLSESQLPSRSEFRRPGIAWACAHAIRSTMIKVARGRICTWDYPWTLKVLMAQGLCVCPRGNLVRNIGFGAEATMTTDLNSPVANLKLETAGKIDPAYQPELAPDPEINRWLAEKSFGQQRRLAIRLIKDLLRRRY